jgi:hypothetical protein
MWDFLEMRELAINTLSQMSELQTNLIAKIALAREYKIPEWMLAAYEGLAKRKKPISVTEAEQLGLTTTVRIFQIREESAAKRQVSLYGSWDLEVAEDSSPFDRKDCAERIRKAFEDELRELGQH